MPGTDVSEVRPLFGGALEAQIPLRFTDVSDVRRVPDNQEVFADPSRDESVLVELLELKADVEDPQAATWFFRDLCQEQDASSQATLESVSELTPAQVPHLDPSIAKSCAVGTMVVSKSREGPDAGNLVRCHLANLRLRSAATDVLITVYEPLVVSESSSTAQLTGAGVVQSSEASEVVPASQLFSSLLSSFKINDWSVFAGSTS